MADLRSLVKNSPAVASGSHIGIVAHITADELRRELSATEVANGLVNRFLMVCARRSKQLPFGGQLIDWCGVVPRLQGAFERAQGIGRVYMTNDAREDWAGVYGALSEGKPGLLGAATGRAEAQVIRLALIYALLDGQAFIDRPHIRAALAVWDYAEASARFVFGDKRQEPTGPAIRSG
jgi:hypothetical protein